jgi:hypothetical protein
MNGIAVFEALSSAVVRESASNTAIPFILLVFEALSSAVVRESCAMGQKTRAGR